MHFLKHLICFVTKDNFMGECVNVKDETKNKVDKENNVSLFFLDIKSSVYIVELNFAFD